MCFYLLFFFSSRRRHTRSLCDWSSDVCSSDLGVSQTAATDPRGLPVTRAFLRTPDGGMLDLGTLGGEHSSAAAVSEVVDGTVWVAGHSHDAAARIRAVLWAVRLGQDQP